MASASPRNPHLPRWAAEGAPAAAEIERLSAGVAAHLHRMRPGVLVAFTADHHNIFLEACVPVFSIVAAAATGASDYPDSGRAPLPLAADLGRHVPRSGVCAGFDVGMSQAAACTSPSCASALIRGAGVVILSTEINPSIKRNAASILGDVPRGVVRSLRFTGERTPGWPTRRSPS